MASLDIFSFPKSRRYLSDAVLPLGILFIVAMMVLPLPTILLDIFFSLNILFISLGVDGGHSHVSSVGFFKLPSAFIGGHGIAPCPERRVDKDRLGRRSHRYGCCRSGD